MVLPLPTTSRICAEKKEHYHNLRQENAPANNSRISVLALATLTMIGLALAVHFGALGVSSAGSIALCYIGGGIAGLGLIVAIALRCRGIRSSNESSPQRVGNAEPQAGLRIRDIVFNRDAKTVKITLKDGRETTVPFTEGSPLNYRYAIDTHCLILDGQMLVHVINLERAGGGIVATNVQTSNHLERLFSDQLTLHVPMPDIRDTVFNRNAQTVKITLKDDRETTVPFTEGHVGNYAYVVNTHCLVLEDDETLRHVISRGAGEGAESTAVHISSHLERLFSDQLTLEVPIPH